MTLARRRSRFLSHFIFNFLNTTADLDNTELLVMASEDDDWNADLFKFFANHPSIKFFFENEKLGKYGRHIFFNRLAKEATGEWLLHTCDDQIFILDGWDNYVRKYIKDNHIDSNKINFLIPRFDNTGFVDHFLSRGYLEQAGWIGGFGNIDSWINNVREGLSTDRTHLMEEKMMRDLTLYPEIYSPEYLNCDISCGLELPKWEDPIIKNGIDLDIEKLNNAILDGH